MRSAAAALGDQLPAVVNSRASGLKMATELLASKDILSAVVRYDGNETRLALEAVKATFKAKCKISIRSNDMKWTKSVRTCMHYLG